MQNMILAMICLFGISTFAGQNQFDLKMELSMNGELVSKPHLVVKEGKTGFVSQTKNGETSFIEVVAREEIAPNGKEAIKMTFVVGKIAKDGTKTPISRPQIFAMPNKKAQIKVGSDSPPNELSLSVVAKKVVE